MTDRLLHRLLRIALGLLLVLVATAFQGSQPKPIPPFEGDGNSQHDGQPQWCQNMDAGGHLHNCDCEPHTGDEECKTGKKGNESSKCGTYCRKSACRCKKQCEMTH